jgi:hypothetical protein
MRIINGLWVFYKKLVIPSAALSVCLGLMMGTGMKVLGMAGFSYIFIAPFFHLMIYDLTNPKEYYFYYNLGLSRLMLWFATVVTSIIIGLILMAI